MNTITIIIIAMLVSGYALYRILAEQPVTPRDLLVPLLGGAFLGYSYLQHANPFSGSLVFDGAFLGILMGLVLAQLIRVWRDESTGIVHQKGNWLFISAYVAMIALRILLEVVLHVSGVKNIPALNDAMLAIAVGSYIGRAINIYLRSLALHGWRYNSLPRTGNLQ